MIKPKKKICSKCQQEKFIWKREGKNIYCQYCWNTIKTPAKVKRVSDKRAIADTVYTKLRKIFLTKHPFCQIKIDKCTGASSEVHHVHCGADREKYYLDTKTWLAGCSNCHKWVHLHPKEAKELGFIKHEH